MNKNYLFYKRITEINSTFQKGYLCKNKNYNDFIKYFCGTIAIEDKLKFVVHGRKEYDKFILV
jgi:hypothetical protein